MARNKNKLKGDTMKDKAKWLARHYQDVAEGGKSQYTYGDGWHDAKWGPRFSSIKSQWRVVITSKVKEVSAGETNVDKRSKAND